MSANILLFQEKFPGRSDHAFSKIPGCPAPCCAALVAAAGSSFRMGGVNKLLQPLDGIPVLARTLTALQMARRIDEIVVAAREEDFWRSPSCAGPTASPNAPR